MSNKKPGKQALFHFKKFSLSDSGCGMKIGTDGVILGSIAATYSLKSVLDVGTGCGLIALMIAQKVDCLITALEIDEQAAFQASQNVANSPWPQRIKVVHSSFQDYSSSFYKKFDLVVCNPPFFQDSLKPPCLKRQNARHTSSLNLSDLISGARNLLNEGGKLLLIIPENQGEQLIKMAKTMGYYITKKLWIIPVIGKPPKRLILELSLSNGVVTESSLIIEDKGRHGYSDSYKKLTGDYYINF